jgi:hypothetical protein
VVLLLLAAALQAFGALLANKRQLTSEVGRIWLMLGAAWFFYMRGTPLAERLARSGTSLGSLARYVLPLAFVALVLVGAMVVTRDMGPLLIAGYAAGAFLAASIAMWAHRRLVRPPHMPSPWCCSSHGSCDHAGALPARRDRQRHRGSSRTSRHRSRPRTTSSRW